MPSALVVTRVVVSVTEGLPTRLDRTPTTPPTGLVILAPSAPNLSGVPLVSTLPEADVPSLTILVSALAKGASSVMVTVTVLVVALPY